MTSRLTAVFAALLTLVFAAAPAEGQGSVESDRAALEVFYDALNGPGWLSQEGWASPRPISEWHGVGTVGGKVRVLSLRRNFLRGEIPPEIGDLTELRRLDLVGNRITGEIPPEIARLTHLRLLWIGEDILARHIDSDLTGEIPRGLGDLLNLERVDLNGNSLTGTIPNVGNLRNLKSLYLDENNLTGEIPRGLGDLLNLEEVDLSRNDLTGEIPRGLGDLLNLETLRLQHNNLTGTIPYKLRRFRNSINPQQDGRDLPVETAVPALPFAVALLLGAGLGVMGLRKVRRR